VKQEREQTGGPHHTAHLGEKLAAVAAGGRRDGHRQDARLSVAQQVGGETLLGMHAAGQGRPRKLQVAADVHPPALSQRHRSVIEKSDSGCRTIDLSPGEGVGGGGSAELQYSTLV